MWIVWKWEWREMAGDDLWTQGDRRVAQNTALSSSSSSSSWAYSASSTSSTWMNVEEMEEIEQEVWDIWGTVWTFEGPKWGLFEDGLNRDLWTHPAIQHVDGRILFEGCWPRCQIARFQAPITTEKHKRSQCKQSAHVREFRSRKPAEEAEEAAKEEEEEEFLSWNPKKC